MRYYTPCSLDVCLLPESTLICHPLALTGFGDLRPYHPDTVSFIGQAYHTTQRHIYNDTLNFLIYAPDPAKPSASRMRVFSISQIGGAYCDDGQNFKNIVVLLKSLGYPFKEINNAGCPPKDGHKGDAELWSA